MARDRPSIALNNDDFPAFGAPAITTSAPFRTSSPAGAVASRSFSDARTLPVATAILDLGIGPSSSSGKSMSYASSDSRPITRSRSSSIRRDKPPSSWVIATRCIAREVESIRSPIASACTRSSLPFSTARRVNSPGSATRAPDATRAARTSVGTTTPPCVAISTTSSPVNDAGARNVVTRASSSTSPFPSRTVHNVARRYSSGHGIT